jgi:hypothetical protein
MPFVHGYMCNLPLMIQNGLIAWVEFVGDLLTKLWTNMIFTSKTICFTD